MEPNPLHRRSADLTGTGMIVNDDRRPEAWVSRFGRTVADPVQDAVAVRIRTEPLPASRRTSQASGSVTHLAEAGQGHRERHNLRQPVR